MDASARIPSTGDRVEFQRPSTDFIIQLDPPINQCRVPHRVPLRVPLGGQHFKISSDSSDFEHDASRRVNDTDDDFWDTLTRGTSIPANPPQEPSSAFPPGFFTQPNNNRNNNNKQERGRTRKPRAKRNTTGIPWIDRRQPPVPPPDAPQMPQPSPDMPMHTPPPTQTRPSDETKVKKKGTKHNQERGRSRRPKWKRNDADTSWINAQQAPLQPSDTPQAPPPSQSRPSDEKPYARSRTPDQAPRSFRNASSWSQRSQGPSTDTPQVGRLSRTPSETPQVRRQSPETPVTEPVSVYRAKPRFSKGVLNETPVPKNLRSERQRQTLEKKF